MFNRVDRYISLQILLPLFSTLAIAAMLLVLERMMRLFDVVANEGGPVSVVWRLIGSLMPHYLGLALPLGLFLGVLLAFRKLAMNSELEALRASGISLVRLGRPAFVIAGLLTVFNLILSGYIQPMSIYSYRSMMFQLTSGAFGASVHAGQFNSLGKDMILRIEEVRNDKTLMRIFFEEREEDGTTTRVTAERGEVLATLDQQTLLMRLYDGVIVVESPQTNGPQMLTFDQQDWPIDTPAAAEFRNRGQKHHEMTLPELALGLSETEGRERNMMVADFNDRVIRSVTLLILPFFAISLGAVSKRSNRVVGLVFGVTILLIFHKTVEFGEASVGFGSMSALQGIWLPGVAFAVMTALMFYISAFKVGANPIGWLEWIWSGFASVLLAIWRWIDRRLPWRNAQPPQAPAE